MVATLFVFRGSVTLVRRKYVVEVVRKLFWHALKREGNVK